MDGLRDFTFERVAADGARSPFSRGIAIERPIAIEVNGIGYAVMMATPTDLTDFALGFALTERLIDRAGDVLAVDHHDAGTGDILRVTLIPDRADRVFERARHRVSESSCGLCGIENLEQALRPLPRLAPAPPVPDVALFRALGALRSRQPLNRATGAVHAAARCRADGQIAAVREDVGRHNAFDKLIGATLADGADWQDGFALLSSRCSYELVEKAALAGCRTLVTISAATDLAIERARACGLRLIVLARPDAMLAVGDAEERLPG